MDMVIYIDSISTLICKIDILQMISFKKIHEVSMGGIGSGRWFRPRERITTEDLPQIDIRKMKRQGVLFP